MARKFQNFKQGIYSPKHKEKLLNKQKIVIYRSKLELDVMRICDDNPYIEEWSSEAVIIPYYNTLKQKNSRYFVDLYVKFKDGKKYLFEIKPEKQMKCVTEGIKQTKNQKMSTKLYTAEMTQMNKDKWLAALAWAKQHGMTFYIITERTIQILKS